MLASTIVEHLREQGRTEEAVSVCEIILQHHPREMNALVSLASAYGSLLDSWRRRYPRPFHAPAEQLAYATELAKRNAVLFARADELGWEPVA